LFAIKEVSKGKRKVKEGISTDISEVYVMKEVNHPNIIKLHETFYEEGMLYMVMEFADDGDLS